MMKFCLFIQLILFVFIGKIYSQDSTKALNPNGYNIIYYPNGKVLSEGYMKDGKPEGYWRTYYTTGVLKSEGNRKNFLTDSIWIFYNTTGDTISKINYLMGKKSGYYNEYVTDRSRPEYIGKVKSKELYVNNVKEGTSYYYYNNGELREIINFRNDKADGESIEFSEDDGRIITLKRYRKGSLTERRRINRFDGNGLKTGEWLEFFEGTRVNKEMNYKEGQLHGYYKEYSRLGNLILTLLYDNGKLVEEVKEENVNVIIREEKDEEGNVIESGPFINEKPVGIHKVYDSDGTIIKSKIYNNEGTLISDGIVDREGFRQGVWKDFYENKMLRAEGSYLNNKREGKWTFYDSSGKIEQVGFYKNGLETGRWIRYYDNGNIHIEEDYLNGKSDGYYTEYDETGKIIVDGSFLEGEQEGKWVEEINDFKAEGEYISGLRNGKWKYFYDNGTVLFEGNYIQGNAEGKHRYYYPDGSLKEEQFYTSGLRTKNWRKFDEKGELIITITYQDGKEYRINGVRIDLPDEKTTIIK